MEVIALTLAILSLMLSTIGTIILYKYIKNPKPTTEDKYKDFRTADGLLGRKRK